MARLSIHLLGPFRVELDGETVIGFSTDKVRALLAYLAVEADQQHRREALAGLLWPDYRERSARASLRTALANLRQVIGDSEADPPFLHVSRQMVQFNSDSDAWIDVRAFTQFLGAEASPQQNIRRLEEAVELYRGSFLEAFSLADSAAFEDWALIEREQLQRRALAALHRLAAFHEQRGDYQRALQFAWRQVELDPWREEAQRQLMRLLDFSGQRAAALAQYEACRRLLAEELGVEPARETTRLYERIRDETLQVTEPPLAPPRLLAQPSFFLNEAVQVAVEEPVFVAREHELDLLDAHLERTLAGHGRVVFVIGDAGQGKTALMEEFGRRAQRAYPELLVTEGICNAHSGVGDSYLPFRQALEMLAGDVEARWAGGRITADHARRLWAILPVTAQLLAAEGPDLIDTIVAGSPLVGRAMAAVPAGTEWLTRLARMVEVRATAQSTGNLRQTDLFEQYARVLQGVARQAPLVIRLDDLQWADQGSVGLLFHLGRQVAESRMLLLCAYRPEELALGHTPTSLERGQQEPHPLESVVNELRRVHGDIVVDLGKEDPAGGKRFVEAFLDSEPNCLGAAFRQTLYARTGGHPLFTVELLRMLQDRGDLVLDKEGRWVEGHVLAWDELPPRVEAVIEKRVGRLGADLRQLLSAASVEGEDFTAQVIAEVQGIPERQLLRALSQQLVKRHRLVRERGELQVGPWHLSRYRFTHNLFQRYMYNELGTGERRLLHAEVARVIEELFADDTEAVTVQLAFHYGRAGLQDKALHYLTRAGHQARARYASQEAVRHYSEGLLLLPEDHPDRFDLLAARSAVYGLMAQREAQRADIDTMLALAKVLDDELHQCDALIALADYFLATEPFLAREPLQQAGEIARRLGDPVREAQTLRRLAWGGRLGADYQMSRIYIEKAAARFTQAGLPGEAASCWLMLARRLPGSGEHTAELEAAEEAVTLSRQAGDLRQEAIALRHLAIAHMNHGRHLEALPLARQALAMHRELGDQSEECHALDVLGVILARLGRSEETETHFRQCLTRAEDIGSDWGVLGAAFGLWNYWYVPRGEYEQLLAFSDERLGKAQAAGREWLIGFFSWLRVVTMSDLGQFEEALGLLAGPEFALVQGDLVSQVLVFVDKGWLRAELGDYGGARQDLGMAMELAGKTGDPYMVGWPLTYQAYLTLLSGEQAEWQAGLETAKRAAALFRDANDVGLLANALDKSARLHLALGELKEALETSTEVMRLLQTTPALPRPQEYLYTHSLVLQALGRKAEADEHLQRAYERVMLVAENTSDEVLRRSWLENVRVNREIVREWAELTACQPSPMEPSRRGDRTPGQPPRRGSRSRARDPHP